MVSSAVSWLLPQPPPSPQEPLQAGREARPATLEVMAARGQLVRVAADVYLPADTVSSRRSRSAALGVLLGPGDVVCLGTAAWLLGAPVPPEPVEVAVPPETGSRTGRRALQVHRLALTPEQVVDDGTVRVTTPARTAADLARRAGDTRARTALTWLLAHAVGERAVLAELRRSGPNPHSRAARAVLRAVRP